MDRSTFGDFDVIVGADIVYHYLLFEPLLSTLEAVLGRDALFYMAHQKRTRKEKIFFARLKRLFQFESVGLSLSLVLA